MRLTENEIRDIIKEVNDSDYWDVLEFREDIELFDNVGLDLSCEGDYFYVVNRFTGKKEKFGDFGWAWEYFEEVFEEHGVEGYFLD